MKYQTNKDSNTNPTFTNKDKNKFEYFDVGPEKEANKEAGAKLTYS